MVAINFTLPNAKELIRSGRKTTTIRRSSLERIRQFGQMDDLELYWMQGTSECERIADATLVGFRVIDHLLDWIDSQSLEVVERDGFSDGAEMRSWFMNHYGDGVNEMEFLLIEWRIKGVG